MMETKKLKHIRNSNIELLRILSMLMVLVLHCLSSSGALEYFSGIDYWVYWWLEALCIIAVDIFVLISGYFMVESRFKMRNVLRIIGGVWIYSVIFSLINIGVSGEALTLNYFIRMVFPFTTKKFWFVNSYIALYLLSPFLNKLIHILNKRQFSVMTAVLIAMFSLRVTILPITWSQDTTGGMGVQSFVTLYCIAAWIRLYYKKNTAGNFKYIIGYILLSLVLVACKKGLLLIGFGEDFTSKLYSYSSILVYGEAVALFLTFLNAKPVSGKIGEWINTVAKHSFSVYIIHFAMLSVLFTKIIPVNQFIDNVITGVPTVMLSVLGVHVFCTCVDIVKTSFGEKICILVRKNRLFDFYNRFVNYVDTMMN